MLKIAVIGLLMSPLFAIASSGESKSFVFQGQHSINMDLRGEITHTAYRTETYQDTCYNSVFDHYENRCVNEPVEVCNDFVGNMQLSESASTDQLVPGPSLPHEPGGGGGGSGGGIVPGPSLPHDPEPSCHTEYRQSCSQEAVYVDVPYSCTRTRQVPYEVKDGNALNHVVLKFGEIPAGVVPNETVKVSASGKDISVQISSNAQAIYSTTQQQTQNSNNGNLVETTTTVNVSIDSITAINQAVSAGLTELTVTKDNISFMIGRVLRPEMLVVKLKIQKSVFLGHKTLLDRELAAGEITLTAVGDKTRVDIQNAALGLDLAGKSLKVLAKVRLAVPANISNPGAISTAQPEQTIKVKP